jgi:hypothetical protein
MRPVAGQILVRYAGDGLAVICLTIMNEEVAAGLAKPISVEKRVTSKTVELSNCLTNRLGR